MVFVIHFQYFLNIFQYIQAIQKFCYMEYPDLVNYETSNLSTLWHVSWMGYHIEYKRLNSL